MTGFQLKRKRNKVIPGFGLSMGITITLLSLVVMIPLISVFMALSGIGIKEFFAIITDVQVTHAFKVSFLCALVAALVNCIFGLILAWILVRYNFPGKKLIDGFIELPFALPTSVAGIALTTIYSDKGWIGSIFAKFGIKISYTVIGITIALIFIGIPFVVRAIQPVLEKFDPQFEEAAAILGANRIKTFVRVIFPEILPAMLMGFGLAFARGIGEYGSVVFIAGNIPYETQIAPLIIISKLEQFNYAGAVSVALVMVIFSFVVLFLINIIQAQVSKIANG